MIRIVVLGSGGAVPSPNRNLSSIAMRYMGDVYLFDCAEGTQRQMMKYEISYAKIKAIFVSHLHPDHWLGIPGLLFTLKMIERKEKLFIFGPKGIKKRIENLIGEGFELAEIREIEIEDVENWKYEVEDGEFRAYKTNHTLNSIGYVFETKAKRRFNKEKCEELGIKGRAFKILEEKKEIKIGDKKIRYEDVTYEKKGKKIVYTGDTAYSDETIKVAKEADLLFHEATFMEEHREEAKKDNHSTVLDACRVAKEANVKKVILFHISNRYKDSNKIEKEGKKEFEHVVVAKDGLEFLI